MASGSGSADQKEFDIPELEYGRADPASFKYGTWHDKMNRDPIPRELFGVPT